MGRPRLPKDLRDLIQRMAAENPVWGEERIANELKLKLGIRVSPRTVAKYLQSQGPKRGQTTSCPTWPSWRFSLQGYAPARTRLKKPFAD